MRKALVVLTALSLLVGASTLPAEAKKKKKKKPVLVQVDQKLFLRSTGCPASSDNSDYLSTTDADEEVECFYTGSGARNEIGNETGTLGAQGQNAVADRETATRIWDATDGVPVVLDAAKPVTAQIWTSGGRCAAGPACSPSGLSGGEMILDAILVGTTGGNVVELGTFTDTYDVQPGTVHEVALSITVDPAYAGVTFDAIELHTWQHGESMGHGVINTNGETSSYLNIPTLVAQ